MGKKHRISPEEQARLDKLAQEYKGKLVSLELNLSFLMAEVACIYIRDVERQFDAIGTSFRHEKRQKFTQLKELVKQVKDIDENFLSNEIWEGVNHQVKGYDLFSEDINTYARLNLLVCEKIDGSEDNQNNLFKFVRSLKDSLGIVEDADVERFRMKKLQTEQDVIAQNLPKTVAD